MLGIGVLATCAFDCKGTPGGNTSDVRGKQLALSQEFLLEIQGLHDLLLLGPEVPFAVVTPPRGLSPL